MTDFKVIGPVEINTTPMGKIYQIDASDIAAFWGRVNAQASQLSKGQGCYVFCIRPPRGYVPWYVGLTLRSFEKECFQSHKLMKYLQAFSYYDRQFKCGFFFVVPERAPGPPNSVAIEALEDILIGRAFERNPDLTNVRGIPEQEHSIRHIYNSDVRGTKKANERSFAKTLGF